MQLLSNFLGKFYQLFEKKWEQLVDSPKNFIRFQSENAVLKTLFFKNLRTRAVFNEIFTHYISVKGL